jgi:hypothetical protein
VELFEHPFAVLTAVFFFQVGTDVAYQPAGACRRYAVRVLAALVGATLAGTGIAAYAAGASFVDVILLQDVGNVGLTALMYSCIGSYLLGFLITVALHSGRS